MYALLPVRAAAGGRARASCGSSRSTWCPRSAAAPLSYAFASPATPVARRLRRGVRPARRVLRGQPAAGPGHHRGDRPAGRSTSPTASSSPQHRLAGAPRWPDRRGAVRCGVRLRAAATPAYSVQVGGSPPSLVLVLARRRLAHRGPDVGDRPGRGRRRRGPDAGRPARRRAGRRAPGRPVGARAGRPGRADRPGPGAGRRRRLGLRVPDRRAGGQRRAQRGRWRPAGRRTSSGSPWTGSAARRSRPCTSRPPG